MENIKTKKGLITFELIKAINDRWVRLIKKYINGWIWTTV